MAKIVIGLDLGFSSIKAVALSHQGSQSKLVSLGSIVSPHPGLSSDADPDLEAVSAAIRRLLEASKIETNEVAVALPESKVFTRVVDDLPFLNDKELSAAIRYASEEFIPMPISEVNLNWQVLSRIQGEKGLPAGRQGQGGRTIVLVVASPKGMVDRYLKVLNKASLRPITLETEIIAATRALIGANSTLPSTLIMQLGSTTTDFAVVVKGLILLTRSISTGGAALTRTLSQQFNFEPMQAEEYKKTYGMVENQLEGKVYGALKPLIDVVINEARRVIQAFEQKHPGSNIKRVVLSGGGAKMPGLVVYMANNLGLEVQEADPWQFIIKDKSVSAKLAAEAPLYSVAVGLALREE